MIYNWVYTIFQLTYCLHYCCVVFAVHSKHLKNNNNNYNQKNNNFENNQNFDNNFWYNNINEQNPHKHKHRIITEKDIWNNYQSYQPSIDENLLMARYEASTERPPYYLSYDSGIQTKFQAMEEQLMQPKQDQHQDDPETNTRTKAIRFGLPFNSEKLSKNRYQIQFDSQIKDQEEEHNHDNRKVGAKGLGGTFGFMQGKHFFPCDKPAFLQPDPQTGNYLVPDNIGYFRKCRYYDDDPRRKYQRKVGALGVNGYYGYFENGRFIECAPPKRLEEDTQNPNLFYIPTDIDYEPKCQYYGYNVSKRFDASTNYPNSFGELSIKTIDKYSVILLPFYVLVLTLNYF